MISALLDHSCENADRTKWYRFDPCDHDEMQDVDNSDNHSNSRSVLVLERDVTNALGHPMKAGKIIVI